MAGGDAGDDFDLRHWVELALLDADGRGGLIDLLREHGSPREALALAGPALRRAVPGHRLRQRVERCLDWLGQHGNHALTMGTDAYPRPLLKTEAPPLLVCASGDVSLLGAAKLMVVGEADATPAGVRNTEIICRALAGRGFTIVSGMGGGIEAAACRGATEATARLALVAGSVFDGDGARTGARDAGQGVDLFSRPYPQADRDPGEAARQLGVDVSDGCLVVEATLRGGALRLAQHALETGKEVFAMPGSINSSNHRGCHRLLRDGAHLVENQEDVLNVIAP